MGAIISLDCGGADRSGLKACAIDLVGFDQVDPGLSSSNGNNPLVIRNTAQKSIVWQSKAATRYVITQAFYIVCVAVVSELLARQRF